MQQPHRSPPPAYGESQSLLGYNQRKSHDLNVGAFVLSILALASIAIGILIGRGMTVNKPVEWDRQRLDHENDLKIWELERKRWEMERVEHNAELEEWQHERQQLREERIEFDKDWATFKRQEYDLHERLERYNRDRLILEKEKGVIAEERVLHRMEQLMWRKDRASWALDRDKWEHEKRRRHNDTTFVYPSDAYWGDLQPELQCHSYGKREYSARLWDIPYAWGWIEACKVTPIEIHGVTINEPDRCEDRGFFGGVVGFWVVDSDERACEPHFGDTRDLGCIDHGSGLRRFEAPILGIQQHDPWEVMCNTTPSTIGGVSYDGPTYCLDNVGIWEHPDPTC